MKLMDVERAIEERREYRSLERIEITDDMVWALVGSVRPTPSCFDKQPWRFVFVRDPGMLERVFTTLSGGNEWATAASMVVAVFSDREDDCIIKDREYFLFDTGMATAFLILRLTEMGLVAHPIAGFGQTRVKEVLGIPENAMVITLIIVDKHSDKNGPLLSEKQAETEAERPERPSLDEFAFRERYSPDWAQIISGRCPAGSWPSTDIRSVRW